MFAAFTSPYYPVGLRGNEALRRDTDAGRCMTIRLFSALCLAAGLLSSGALAQEAQEPIAFDGGQLTVAENDDGETVLSFDGKELVRDGRIYFDRVETLAGTPVAIFTAGPGGNVCDPYALLVWKADGAVKTDNVGEDDCSIPSPTLEDDRLVFVPSPAPGETMPIRSWSPSEGEKVAGEKTFQPDAGTGWADVVAGKFTHPQDFFNNADIFAAAQTLLGTDFGQVVTSLSVAGEPAATASGLLYGYGCAPHACSISDGFIGVDAKAQKLYFAVGPVGPELKTWPAQDQWPAELQATLNDVLKKPE